MIEYMCVQAVEIIVGIIVALIFLGGSGAYIAYRLWAKKHGKSICDGNCAHCAGCHVTDLEAQKKDVRLRQENQKEKDVKSCDGDKDKYV